MKRLTICSRVLALALLGCPSTLTPRLVAAPLITRQEAKLTSVNATLQAGFGCSVSLNGDGNTALVGTFEDSTPAADRAGSAYVFVRSGSSWSQQAKLMADDGADYDCFGWSVSLSADGNTALVGACNGDTPAGQDAGSAYVFVRSGSSWSQQAKLTADDGAAGDISGVSVSLSEDGTTALVGAPSQPTAAVPTGGAYVFVRSGGNWSQQAKLTADDGAEWDSFGVSVSLSRDGTTALVGAFLDDAPVGQDAGSAYVFVRGGSSWSQQAKLTADDAAEGDCLGSSVSLSGDGNTALVGAAGNHVVDPGGAEGAYVFVRNGSVWTQQVKLKAEGGVAEDAFGCSVSLSWDGTTALIGAYVDDTPGGIDAGSACLFQRSGSNWSQEAKLTANDGAAHDQLGWSASLSGDGTTALVGALWDDTPAGEDAGSAYVFQISSPDGPPILFSQSSGNSVVISWWPEAPGFALEATDNLMWPAWTPVVGSTPVTIPMAGPARFYRLKKP